MVCEVGDVGLQFQKHDAGKIGTKCVLITNLRRTPDNRLKGLRPRSSQTRSEHPCVRKRCDVGRALSRGHSNASKRLWERCGRGRRRAAERADNRGKRGNQAKTHSLRLSVVLAAIP